MLRLVINVDHQINRWTLVAEQFLSLGLKIQRVPAVDAKRIPIPWNKVAPLGSFEKFYSPIEMSAPEVCCYLSHMRCWELLLSSNEKWAAIFEDDVLLSNRSKTYLLSPNWVPKGIHILQFHTMEKKWSRKTLPRGIPVIDGAQIFQVIKPTVGACGYLIDREAAEKALELSKRIAAPIDEFLFNFKSPFTAIYPARGLNPACVFHNNIQVPSVVEGERKKMRRRVPLWHRIHPTWLFLSAKENVFKRILGVDTVFTWE